MKKHKKHIEILSFLLFFFLCTLISTNAAVNQQRVLSIGTGNGKLGDIVSLPVTIDKPDDIGGMAFTVIYDPKVFEFVGLEKANKDISNNEQCDPANDILYQVNKDIYGKVIIAAATASAISNNNLFKLKFRIKKDLPGTYPIRLAKSIIMNPAAGYDEPEFIPVLVGFPPDKPDENGFYPTPVFTAKFKDGSITVAAKSSYSISGKVTYQEGGLADDGTPVILREKIGSIYVFRARTVVKNGQYSFENLSDGVYKIIARSIHPQYYDASVEVEVKGKDVTQDITLPKPVYITGTVTINNKVIPGVRVKVFLDNNLIGEYPVDKNGNFNAGPLPPPPNGKHYSLKAAYGNKVSEEFEENLDWKLTLHKIEGKIDGLPANTTLTIIAASDTAKLFKKTKVTTNDNGKAEYTLEDLIPASDYIVSAIAEGMPVMYYNGKIDITDADPVDIANSDASDINFSYANLTKGTVSGKVLENGKPVPDASVFAFEINTFALSSVLTNNNGEYTFQLTPGSYELFVIKSNGKIFYYSDSGTTQNESDATIIKVKKGDEITHKDIDITECNEILTGKVTFDREDGDPVANVLITAIGERGRAIDITKDDGTYKLTGLCSGEVYTVKMEPLTGNYGIQKETITAGKDKTCNFIIKTGNTLSGTIKNEQGQGIAGALIFLIDYETKQLAGEQIYVSEVGGKYTIKGLPDGIYTIRVTHPEYQTFKEEKFKIEQDTKKDITLTKGAHFAGTVTDKDTGKPIPGVVIIVTRPGGTPLYDITNKSGKYAIYGLDENKSDYIIMAQKRGYNRTVLTDQKPTTGNDTVDIVLSKPTAKYVVSGKVTTTCDNKPVENAEVVLSSKKTHFLDSVFTDKDGNYEFKDVPQSDDYKLIVIAPEYPVYVEKNLDINSNLSKDISLKCGADTEISGKVTWNGEGEVLVLLYTDRDEFIDYRNVKKSGDKYVFKGLDSNAKYKVLAVGPEGNPKWYNGKDSIDKADLVSPGNSKINFEF